MNFKRFSRSSWRRDPGRHSVFGKLDHAESQLSLGAFKKNGFTHHDLEGLTRIPTYEAWKEEKNTDNVQESIKAPEPSIFRVSSHETLAHGGLHHEARRRRTSETDSLKNLSNETEVEKGSAGIHTPPDSGRVRPEVFKTTWKEIVFVCCILVSLSMAEFVISGFQVLLPALIEPLEIPQASRTWPSSVLTLVVGSFLFPMGRLADMFGGYLVYAAGMAWFITWTIISGLAQNFEMLVVCRAMSGLGAAAYLPAGITMLGRIYRPGPRKNLVFSVYGALSPIGFFSGIVTGGLANDFLSWKWFFWIGGILAALSYTGVVLIAPKDYAESRSMNIKMDWLGVFTMIPGLMLVVFAIQDSSRSPQGWGSPRIIICLIIGILFLCSAVYVEGWVAEAPLIPSDIFRVKHMKRMLIMLFLTWGVFAIYLFYSNFFIQHILHKAPLQTALWFAPWAIGGVTLAALSGFILHLVPGSILLVISGVSKTMAVLFFALMPEEPNYWAWVMPAMLFEATCVDVVWIVSNVFLTTSLPKNRQGLAGALINVSVYLGSAFFLALADVASGVYEGLGWDERKKYQGIFFFGVGLGSVALIICLFIPLGRATGSPESEPASDGDRPRSANSATTLCDSPILDDGTETKREKKLGHNSSSTLVSRDGIDTKSKVSN